MEGIRIMPFTDSRIANLFSVARLIETGFRIVMDSDVEDCLIVETPQEKVINSSAVTTDCISMTRKKRT